MPGGGGGGKARPPDMRLRRERRNGAVVYIDGSPKSPLWRWVRALAAFAAVAFFLGLMLLVIGSSVLRAAGRQPESSVWLAASAWGVGAAASLGLVLLRPARREVEPSQERRALVFRRIYLWGPPREREHRKPDVEAVALLAENRGGPYLQLKLVFADGGLLFVEQGKELERMRELARDVAAALGLPVTSFPAPAPGMTFSASLKRLTLASGEVRWLDLDYVGRLVGTWAACLGSALVSALGALGMAYAIGEWWSAGKSRVPVLGILIMALMLFAGAVLFVACVVYLWLPRYRGVRLPLKGGCVVLQRLGRFGRRWDEALLPDGATAVVLVRNRKGVPRQVWLERPGGRRLYIDGGKDEGLSRLAHDLAGPLRVQVRGERRGFFLL